ncbi:MAG: o-succinylbenzoate--CoA ligase [Anaerolineales bacterium]
MPFNAPPLTLAAQAHPRRPALIDGATVLDYAGLEAQVSELAGRLAAHGIRPGDRVAVLLDRSAAAVRLVHAVGRLGALLVPLNTRLTADEMRWQVEKAGCRAALSTLPASPLAEALPLDALPAPVPAPPAAVEMETPFGILFTSGTTGRPKGALLTWGNLFWSAVASAFRLGALPDDRWLLTLPLYHIGGLSILIRSALYGSAVALPGFADDRFDLAALWQRLHADRVTLVSLVPTIFYRLLEAHPKGTDWPASLRLILLGGAAVTPETRQAALKAGLPLAVTYGLSEAASQVATATPEETRAKPGTVGKPLMGTRLRVVDADGRDRPAGEIGEVLVSGPTVMRGYDGDPQATARALQGGWLHTGDLGYLDADGDLWIVQRRSDLIVSGGENVYPAEVEAVLREHPAVAEACVVGLPHPEWGQQVAAAVTLRRGAAVSGEALRAFLRGRLAGYKIPRRIAILPSLPQTASGKIVRRRVAEILESDEQEKDD